MNRTLSVHTFVLDEIDPNGCASYLCRMIRRSCRADLQELPRDIAGSARKGSSTADTESEKSYAPQKFTDKVAILFF